MNRKIIWKKLLVRLGQKNSTQTQIRKENTILGVRSLWSHYWPTSDWKPDSEMSIRSHNRRSAEQICKRLALRIRWTPTNRGWIVFESERTQSQLTKPYKTNGEWVVYNLTRLNRVKAVCAPSVGSAPDSNLDSTRQNLVTPEEVEFLGKVPIETHGNLARPRSS